MNKYLVYVRFEEDTSLRCVYRTYSLESANTVLNSLIFNCSVADYQIIELEEIVIRKKLCAK